MTIDTGGLPTHVSLAVGEERALPLPSYAGAGLDWTATPLSETDMAEIRIDIGSLPATTQRTDGTTEPPPMAIAPERLVIIGRAVGVTTYRLRLARTFDPDHPAAEHDLTVEVTR